MKVVLWCVREATGYLPRGMERSLGDERIVVYDRDFATGRTGIRWRRWRLPICTWSG